MSEGKQLLKHWLNHDYRYLCNKACSVTKEKVALMSFDVTCKNCIRLLSRGKT